MNPLRWDFKYPTDFGFWEKCRIPSDSDADLESVTSLVFVCGRMSPGLSKKSAQNNLGTGPHRGGLWLANVPWRS